MGNAALGWLLADTAGPVPDVLVAGVDAPAGVLAAMTGDGLLVPVAGGVHVAADRAGAPAVRAAALAAVIGPQLARDGVVGGAAALWVTGALAAFPVVVVLLPPAGAGGSAPRRAGVRVRAAALEAADVVDVGAVRLTSPARTAADLARWPQTDPELLVLALRVGCSPREVEDRLRRVGRAPGSLAGLARLRAAQRALGSGLLPAPRQPVHVEDAVDAAHRAQDVPEVGGVGHLEGEPGQGDAVA